MVGIPLNTVYSRLRAARLAFEAEVAQRRKLSPGTRHEHRFRRHCWKRRCAATCRRRDAEARMRRRLLGGRCRGRQRRGGHHGRRLRRAGVRERRREGGRAVVGREARACRALVAFRPWACWLESAPAPADAPLRGASRPARPGSRRSREQPRRRRRTHPRSPPARAAPPRRTPRCCAPRKALGQRRADAVDARAERRAAFASGLRRVRATRLARRKTKHAGRRDAPSWTRPSPS